MERETRWLAVTVSNLSGGEEFDQRLRDAARVSGYKIALYDSTASLVDAYPENDTSFVPSQKLPAGIVKSLNARDGLPLMPRDSESEVLDSYIALPQAASPLRYLQAGQLKDEIYEPIKTIRWIIYYGMFISIGLIILVSIWMSRYLTKPITQIKNVARDIAEGDVEREINIERGDEFGTLATSLNQMSSKLRADTEQIKQYAEKQRQFFADITHEIRNPLHTISGALEMLELENLSPEKRKKYIKTAKNQTERISRLFKDLKTLQQYDSDEHFVEIQEFDLAMIAEHMEEWHSKKAGEKNIELNIDSHQCRVVGDPAKIEQVVDNLVSNALKYTNQGQVNLRYESENGKVRIEVEDSGIGISHEHLDRLFDRFYRTDKARSRDKGGTGLGLAVVKSILSAHDTDIKVESEVGKGSRFWFLLPKAPR